MASVMCLYLSMQEEDIFEQINVIGVSFAYPFSQLIKHCVTWAYDSCQY